MRILLKGQKAQALERVLTLEGDEIVDENPDFVITSQLLKPEEDQYNCPVVGGDCIFPEVVLASLSLPFPVSVQSPLSFLVFKWFDLDWREQTLFGIPLKTLMNEDLGPKCENGMVCNFVSKGPLLKLFDNDKLKKLLRELNYLGFVSFGISLDEIPKIKFIQTGVPFNGFFNVMEATRGRTSDFITGEDPTLFESWTANLVLSVSPWPFREICGRVCIRGVSPIVEKHLYLFGVENYRKSYYTERTLIGIATAWSSSLKGATSRVLQTLRNIELKEKQFRTDQRFAALKVYDKLQEMKLLGE